MHNIPEDVRESVSRSRNYAEAFLALTRFSQSTVAQPAKYRELLTTAHDLLETAAADLNEVVRSSALMRGDGFDV